VREEKRVSLSGQILKISDEQNNPGRYPGLSPRCGFADFISNNNKPVERNV